MDKSSPNGLYCKNCGAALAGQQEQWCGNRCAKNGWAKTNKASRAKSMREWRGRVSAKAKPIRLTRTDVRLIQTHTIPRLALRYVQSTASLRRLEANEGQHDERSASVATPHTSQGGMTNG